MAETNAADDNPANVNITPDNNPDSRREKNVRKDFPCTYANCGKVFHRRTCLTNHLKAHLNPHSRSIRRNARQKRYGLKKPDGPPLNPVTKQLVLARYVVKRDDTINNPNPIPVPKNLPNIATTAAVMVNETCASLALLANTAVNVASLAPLHVPPPPLPHAHSPRQFIQPHHLPHHYRTSSTIPLLPSSQPRPPPHPTVVLYRPSNIAPQPKLQQQQQQQQQHHHHQQIPRLPSNGQQQQERDQREREREQAHPPSLPIIAPLKKRLTRH